MVMSYIVHEGITGILTMFKTESSNYMSIDARKSITNYM